MKEIKIFIGSSLEQFGAERNELQAFLRGVSDRTEKYGVKITPLCSENCDPCVSAERKQDEFNALVCSSDICLFLFYTRAGKYSVEEFERAYALFKEKNRPKIYVFFKEPEKGVTPDISLDEFKNKLENEYGNFARVYSHLDTVKLTLLMAATVYSGAEEPKICGENFIWNGVEIPLGNVAAFSKNVELNALQAELKKAEEEYFELLPLAKSQNADAETLKKFREAAKNRQNLRERTDELKRDILKISLSLTHDEIYGILTPRMKPAYRFLEAGDFEGCLKILDKDDVDGDFDLWERQNELHRKDRASAYIREHKLAVDVLCANANKNGEACGEIEYRYEKILSAALKYGVEADAVYGYLEWLTATENFKKAVDVGEKLEELYKKTGDNAALARLYCHIGADYLHLKDFNGARETLEKALRIWQKECKYALTEESLIILADFYDQLALTVATLPAGDDEIKNGFFTLSLMARRLKPDVEKNGPVNFAPLDGGMNHKDAARKTEEFFVLLPDDFKAAVKSHDGQTDFNYTNVIAEAEELSTYAYCIRKRLADVNFTEKTAKGLILTLGNLCAYWGMLKRDVSYCENAAKESLELCGQIKKLFPKADVRFDEGFNLHNLAVAEFEKGDLTSAKIHVDGCLRIFGELAEENPYKTELKYARALFGCAHMLRMNDAENSVKRMERCRGILRAYNSDMPLKEDDALLLVRCDVELCRLYLTLREKFKNAAALFTDRFKEAHSVLAGLGENGADMRQRHELALYINLLAFYAIAPHDESSTNTAIKCLIYAIKSCNVLTGGDVAGANLFWLTALSHFDNFNFEIHKIGSPEVKAVWDAAYPRVLRFAFDIIKPLAAENPLTLIPAPFRGQNVGSAHLEEGFCTVLYGLGECFFNAGNCGFDEVKKLYAKLLTGPQAENKVLFSVLDGEYKKLCLK